jgi:uncharacterized protein (DUF433 family)
MKQLAFTQTVPLYQDEYGAVRVIGSRVTLDSIVNNFKRGATAEQIQDSFPSLSLREIYGAIYYYLEPLEDVEAYLQARQRQAHELREQIESQPHHSEFKQKIRQRRSQLVRA